MKNTAFYKRQQPGFQQKLAQLVESMDKTCSVCLICPCTTPSALSRELCRAELATSPNRLKKVLQDPRVQSQLKPDPALSIPIKTAFVAAARGLWDMQELPIRARILETFLGHHLFTPYLNTLVEPQGAQPWMEKMVKGVEVKDTGSTIEFSLGSQLIKAGIRDSTQPIFAVPAGKPASRVIRCDGIEVCSDYDWGTNLGTPMEKASQILAEFASFKIINKSTAGTLRWWLYPRSYRDTLNWHDWNEWHQNLRKDPRTKSNPNRNLAHAGLTHVVGVDLCLDCEGYFYSGESWWKEGLGFVEKLKSTTFFKDFNCLRFDLKVSDRALWLITNGIGTKKDLGSFDVL